MPDASLRFLSDEESLARLADATVCRVAVVLTGVPHVVPVNYVLLDGDVVFRSGSGTKLHAALLEQPVAIEVDRLDEATMTGWSVLVSGQASVVDDAGVLERLDGVGLVTWAPGPREEVVRVRIDTISGRAVERTP